jgi:mRNA-degrading endonuclease toxin of MazEF toxin-antitoxin module
MTKAVRRGEVWAVDFESQTHWQQPGKKEQPALVIQTDALNKAGHRTTIVVPGKSPSTSASSGQQSREPLTLLTRQTLVEARRATAGMSLDG